MKRFFHISAAVIIDGSSSCGTRYVEMICVDENISQHLPLADIRRSIIERIDTREAERITFLLNHVEEISEKDYQVLKGIVIT